MRNALASVWHWIALFFMVAIWLVWAVEMPHGYAAVLHFFIVTALLLIGARLVLIVLLRHGSIGLCSVAARDRRALSRAWRRGCGCTIPPLSALLRLPVYLLCVLGAAATLRPGRLHLARRERTWPARRSPPSARCGHHSLLAFAVWEAANAAIQRHLARLQQEPADRARRLGCAPCCRCCARRC